MKAARYLSIALPVLLAVVAQGAESPFSLEQVLSAPFPEELTSSPDGKRLAWFLNDQGRRNLWVAQAPDFKARQLTPFNIDDGMALSELRWSRDGSHIVFVRGQGRNTEGENPNPANDPAGTEQAVWRVACTGGPARRLGAGAHPAVSVTGRVAWVADGQIWTAMLGSPAAAKQMFSARGRNGSPVWSPDGRILAFVSDRDDHSFIGLYCTQSNTIRYLAPSVDRDHSPRWSPDGKQIAFIRQPGRGGDQPRGPGGDITPSPWAIWQVDAATLGAREIWSSGSSVEASFPRLATGGMFQWTWNGKLIFASEQDGWMHLYSLSDVGGDPVLLSPGECEVEDAALSLDRKTVIYVSNCGDIDRRHLWAVDMEGGAPRQVTRGDKIDWSPAPLERGRLAFLRSDARYPAAPFVLAEQGGEARPIAPELIPKDFPGALLVDPQEVIVTSADGWRIHCQLFIPREAGSQELPAVIFMHGGPIRQMLLGWHYRYYYHNTYALNQYLASRGFLVMSVNFRSGIGYGRKFREAPGRGARGASEYQDILAAAQYLRSRPDVDSSRIGLWGGSYGGYLTALGLARNSDIFAAGVDLHGVHDWSTRRFRAWAGPDSPEVVKTARESSPVASVDRWKSPVLLVHGDDDRNVDFSQTVDLVQRLRARKVEFEQLVYPDEVHDFLLHKHWLEVYKAAAEFFAKHLAEGLRPLKAPRSVP